MVICSLFGKSRMGAVEQAWKNFRRHSEDQEAGLALVESLLPWCPAASDAPFSCEELAPPSASSPHISAMLRVTLWYFPRLLLEPLHSL